MLKQRVYSNLNCHQSLIFRNIFNSFCSFYEKGVCLLYCYTPPKKKKNPAILSHQQHRNQVSIFVCSACYCNSEFGKVAHIGAKIQQQYHDSKSCVEAGQNTSTVALQVVEGNKKRTWCLGVQLGHPVTWSSRLGVEHKADNLTLCENYCCKIQRVKTGWSSS